MMVPRMPLVELEIRGERLMQTVVGASLEHIASGLVFTEGPVWDAASGSLIFSDIIGNCMYRWSSRHGLSIFRRPSNMANGNALDQSGRLLTCEHATSRVTRTDHDGSIEVLASHYADRELNSPNDIVVKSDGAIYFTDPTSGRSARYGVERPQQLPFRGVYRIEPHSGDVTLLVDDFEKPNGLCFSRDEQQLFVNDTARGHIRVFDLRSDGTLEGGHVWADVSGDGPGVPDGMKLDGAGNVWCTGPDGMHVFAPDASSLGTIRLPERVANMAWGNADRCTLYITASTSVYAIRTKMNGHCPVGEEVQHTQRT